jgi:D-sedoheptulose 7-phosphate isomerase
MEMNSKNQHLAYFELLKKTLDKLDTNQLEKATQAFYECYERGGNFIIFGNGGSAATASHIAGDFVKGASFGLEKRFRFFCLNDNTSALMAIANDISYEDVFLEQIKNFLTPQDLVIGISGSGNSMNVVKAMEYAKVKKVDTLALCGYKGGKIKELADIALHAEVDDMEITEDIHMIIFHTIKQSLIKKLHAGKDVSMGAVYDARVK